jgi:hypothetical protein
MPSRGREGTIAQGAAPRVRVKTSPSTGLLRSELYGTDVAASALGRALGVSVLKVESAGGNWKEW